MAIGLPHHREPVEVGDGRRAQEHAVDDAENRGVRADSQREGQDRDNGESAVRDELPDGEPKVLEKRLHALASPKRAGATAAKAGLRLFRRELR